MGVPTAADDATRPLTFKLAEHVYDELVRLAEKDDRTVSALLRLAVRDYLDARKGSAS